MNPQDPLRPSLEQPDHPTPVSGQFAAPEQSFENYAQTPTPPPTSPMPTASTPLAPPLAPERPQPLSELSQPQQTTYPSDYLNTIAATPPRRTINKFALFAMIGGVIIAAVIAVVFLSSLTKQPNISEQSVVLRDRIATLQLIADEHQKHLADNRLRVTNATLSATMTSMDKDLQTIMTERSIKVSKKTSATEESYRSDLQNKLNDAYLLGSLDRTYPTEMTYQLSLLKSQLRRLASRTKSESVTTFYNSNIASIDQLSKDLSAFVGDK